MKIHEYQGKAILAPFGVPIPRGEMTTSAAEAGAIARKLGGPVSVVKAQIHAGGRGKGGGVKVVKSPEEAEKVAAQIPSANSSSRWKGYRRGGRCHPGFRRRSGRICLMACFSTSWRSRCIR